MSGKAKESRKCAVHGCHSFIGKLTDRLTDPIFTNGNDLIHHDLGRKQKPIGSVWFNVDTHCRYIA